MENGKWRIENIEIFDINGKKQNIGYAQFSNCKAK